MVVWGTVCCPGWLALVKNSTFCQDWGRGRNGKSSRAWYSQEPHSEKQVGPTGLHSRNFGPTSSIMPVSIPQPYCWQILPPLLTVQSSHIFWACEQQVICRKPQLAWEFHLTLGKSENLKSFLFIKLPLNNSSCNQCQLPAGLPNTKRIKPPAIVIHIS